MQVTYQGKPSNAITMAVAPASPGQFTVAQAGSGQGCILNQDYSLNSAANPAARGDVVMIWGTGGGQTVPASADGQFTTGTPARIPPPVTATIGGADAEVTWSGAARRLIVQHGYDCRAIGRGPGAGEGTAGACGWHKLQ